MLVNYTDPYAVAHRIYEIMKNSPFLGTGAKIQIITVTKDRNWVEVVGKSANGGNWLTVLIKVKGNQCELSFYWDDTYGENPDISSLVNEIKSSFGL